MAEIKYLDFDLSMERSGDAYLARVLNSPAGEATSEFTFPFTDVELENLILRMGRTTRGVRGRRSAEGDVAKAFGGRVFNAVFGGEVRGVFRSSLDEASRRGTGLRIRLRFANAPELADLPWEYLYNPSLDHFLGLSDETPLVRYFDLAEQIRPLAVTPPLRVLVMISSPKNHEPIDVKREWSNIRSALGDLEARNLVETELLEDAQLPALQRRLRNDTFHIFHFIGHGSFDNLSQEGVLFLVDSEGRSQLVSARSLGTILRDHRSLRLAILNACEGARTSRIDPFAGVAQTLLRQRIPAVIAMQFEITDIAAVTFGHTFYEAIADGYPIDAAIAEARKAIFAEGNDIEWGTPVLYSRAADGVIFDLQKTAPLEPPRIAAPKPADPVSLAPAAKATESFTGKETVENPLDTPAEKVPLENSRRKRNMLILVAVPILLVLLAAFGIWRLQSGNPPNPVHPTSVVNPLTHENMINIKAGTYTIGVEDPDGNHAPQQPVPLAGYWIDRFEVKNRDYATYLSNPALPRPHDWVNGVAPPGKDEHPVHGVTWQMALDYCTAVGKRLPTETEWEVAARGTRGLLFPWGDDEDAVALPPSDTYPVGSMTKNQSDFGVFDMAGNVWEWVDEPYVAVPEGSKLMRGGANNFLKDMAYRLIGDPTGGTMIRDAGFRCAADQ